MWVVLIASVALAACSGGGDSVSGPTASPRNFVSAQAAIEASAESYRQQVQSFEGTMTIGFGADGDQLETAGDIKYVAPDQAYVSMDIPAYGDLEVLVSGEDIYFAKDGEWRSGNFSAFGIDLEEFRQYAEDRGPVDYADALDGLVDLTKVQDEQIDGKTYSHYIGSIDLASLSEEVPEGAVDPSVLEYLTGASTGASMDIYVDSVTLLPRRYTMGMSTNFGEASFTMRMQMDFLKYNEDVDMPEPPADAEEFDYSD
jgi:hypothetical protein